MGNGGFIPGSSSITTTSPRGESGGPKSIPSFLENKNNHLKNSLFVGDSQN